MNSKNLTLLITLTLCSLSYISQASTNLNDWPHIKSTIKKDDRLEKKVAHIVANMTLEQKVGQMTQAETKAITPEEVAQYYLGSVLSAGSSFPKTTTALPSGDKHSNAADWVNFGNKFYDAALDAKMETKVPLLWGIDAVHGNNKVYGATIFPHNIALGATHEKILVQKIAASAGKAVRAAGVNWAFAPTVAVARDDRWGRTYESFSEDSAQVKEFAGAYVHGLQGDLKKDTNVVATIKHFIGDGCTDQGQDQGNCIINRTDMINIHGQGYYSGLAAGAQTVMASFSSWNDVANNTNYGVMHGSTELLTNVLKNKMGFDGFVVSDFDGIEKIPGCAKDSCPEAINAGIDMIMVPNDWKSFIVNTIKQVKRGEISMSRIDDAVTRIIRVKMRAGLFDKKSTALTFSGTQEALQNRKLAREAVRKSLVLLKNDRNILPLSPHQKILIVGKNADNIGNQTGGWSLSWQGADNKNSDFPNADSIATGIISIVGKENVVTSVNAKDIDVSQFDAVIAIIGEKPYAEGQGDIAPSGTLRHTERYPEDLKVLQAVANKGKPVITVFLSGRPLYVNDLLNLSNSFVAAWLPGTEGKGISDVIFRKENGHVNYDFSGTLSFSWPRETCQTSLNIGDKNYNPLFPLNFGLKYSDKKVLGKLPETYPEGGCSVTKSYPVFTRGDRASFPLRISNRDQQAVLPPDLEIVMNIDGIKVETTQIKTQEDARLVTWSGAGTFSAHSDTARTIPINAVKNGVLKFDIIVINAPKAKVFVSMDCEDSCNKTIDISKTLGAFVGKKRQSISIPLSCFLNQNTEIQKVYTPFRISTENSLSAAFANIEIIGNEASNPESLRCP